MLTKPTTREAYVHARYWIGVARECASLLVRGRKREVLTDVRLAMVCALLSAAEWRDVARRKRGKL